MKKRLLWDKCHVVFLKVSKLIWVSISIGNPPYKSF